MGESYACEVCLNKAVVNLKNRPLRCALYVFGFFFFPDAELPLFAIRSCFVLSFLELSLCAGNLQLDSRRREFASSGNRKLYFDTHALVCVLEENGNPLPVVTRCHRETLYLTASWWSHLISHISLWLWSLQVAFWSVSMFLSSLFFCFFFFFLFKGIFASSVQLRLSSYVFSLSKWSVCL